MAKVDLSSAEWCDLIFSDKNKAYGAYKMRENSPKRHSIAVILVIIIALIGFSIPTLIKMATPKQKEVMTEVTTLSQLEEPEVKQEEMKRVEPVAPPPPALKSCHPIQTISYKFKLSIANVGTNSNVSEDFVEN